MTMLPMKRPMMSPRNARMQQVAQSLMAQGPTPVYGVADALTNILRPVAGAYGMKRAGEREERERKAETTAMGRLLQKAQEAREAGADPLEAVNAEVAARGGEAGYGAAGESFARQYQQAELGRLLQGPAERKILKDATGRQRYADTGEMVFSDVEMPAAPRKTRELKVGENVVTQEFDPATGSWTEIATSPRRSGIQINMPKDVSEIEGKEEAILRNRRKYEETKDPKYARIADRIEMELAFGGKPPESYVKARNSINQAREGIGETYELISKGQANPLSPSDRAKVSQSINKAKLAYADLLNRGANFTETEQAMVNAILGGDPNDVLMRALRGDQSYLDNLRAAGEALERRGQGMLESFTSPNVGTYEYPWQRQEDMPPPQAAAPAQERQRAPAAAQMAPTPQAGRFSDMAPQQIQTLDIDSLTDEEVNQVMRRMDALGM